SFQSVAIAMRPRTARWIVTPIVRSRSYETLQREGGFVFANATASAVAAPARARVQRLYRSVLANIVVLLRRMCEHFRVKFEARLPTKPGIPGDEFTERSRRKRCGRRMSNG